MGGDWGVCFGVYVCLCGATGVSMWSKRQSGGKTKSISAQMGVCVCERRDRDV